MNIYQFIEFALGTTALLVIVVLIIFVAVVAGPTPL